MLNGFSILTGVQKLKVEGEGGGEDANGGSNQGSINKSGSRRVGAMKRPPIPIARVRQQLFLSPSLILIGFSQIPLFLPSFPFVI